MTLPGDGVFVAFYRPNGQLRRAVAIDPPWRNVRDIAVGPGDSLVVVGHGSWRTQRRDYFPPYLTWYSGGGSMYIASLTATGGVRWINNVTLDSYGSSTTPRVPQGGVAGVVVDAAGNIGVAGAHNAGDPQFLKHFGSSDSRSFQNVDVFVASYASGGALRWARRAGGNGARVEDRASGIAIDSTGALHVTGRLYAATDATFGVGSDSVTLKATTTAALGSLGVNEDVFVASFASAGTLQWAFRGPRQQDILPRAVTFGYLAGPRIAVDRAGGFLLAARFVESVSFGTGSRHVKLTAGSSGDGYLARYGT